MQFDALKDFTEPSVDEENKIAPIANELYNRIAEETNRLLMIQLQVLGIDPGHIQAMPTVVSNLRKILYTDDPLALATYEYEGKTILGVKISENRMAIEFDVPNLTKETQKREVQNETVQR